MIVEKKNEHIVGEKRRRRMKKRSEEGQKWIWLRLLSPSLAGFRRLLSEERNPKSFQVLADSTYEITK